MPHAKFQALANRVKKNRLEHLNQIENSPTEAVPYMARSKREIHGKQITLSFAGEPRAIEIFHQFDSQAREIEWSYYTEDGKFLLQFSFGLDRQEYQVHSFHPALFQDQREMKVYLNAIEETLGQHYPPLSLIRERNGSIEFRRIG